MWLLKQKSRPSQSQRILTALKANNHGITAKQMLDMGAFKYSSRISELRKDGHNIYCARISNHNFKYYLIRKDQ